MDYHCRLLWAWTWHSKHAVVPPPPKKGVILHPYLPIVPGHLSIKVGCPKGSCCGEVQLNLILFVLFCWLGLLWSKERGCTSGKASQADGGTYPHLNMQCLHVLSSEKVIFDFSFLQIFWEKVALILYIFFKLLQEMKAAKEKENRTRRGFLDDSSLSCLLSDDTVSVDR